MIVRELIAVLGIELDDRDVKKVDNAVSKFEGRMQKVGQAIGGTIFLAGLARAAGAVIGFASDAQETLGLVRETFGENAAEVEAWSRTISKEVGRSEFLMREMAGTLGAILTPALEGNTEASAEMSTTLAALAVDLASLFNTSESEALIKLKAGLVGSTEPLLSFGVNLQVASLQAFALDQGITKTVKTMTEAEKVTLRYQLILAKTTTAQGDAARTADGFANASRAAADGVKDLATRIGQQLLPVASRFMVWTRDAARSLTAVFQSTNLLQSGVIVLAGGLAIAGVLMLAPFVGFLFIAVKVIAIMAILTAVVDEIITLFEGGTTVIGEFVDSMLGIGATQVIIDSIKDGWILMAEAMDDSVLKLAEWALAADDAMGSAGKVVSEFVDGFKDDLKVLSGAFTIFWDDISKRFPVFTKVVEAFGKANAKIASAPGDLLSAALGGLGRATGLQGLGSDISNAFSADTFDDLRTRRTAVGQGIGSRSVGARQGSTSARLRLSRARELAGKKRLTKAQRTEFAQISEAPRQATATAVATGAAPVSGGTTVNASVVINEATNPEAVERAVQRGISNAVADAGAATARGVR